MRAISLLYHDVVPDGQYDTSGFPGPAAARYKLELPEFKRHLGAIAATRHTPITVLDVLGGRARGPAPLLLTFDDGGASAYVQVAPPLADLGWPAHFFVTVGCIDHPSFLSRPQVRALRRMGHVVGSHSCSHPERMSRCSWEQLVREWSTSVAILSDILGEPVSVASLPGGYYSSAVARAASLAGIRALFTSEPVTACRPVDGCLVLGRFTIVRGTDPETAAALAAGKRVPRLRQFLVWNLKKVPKTLGGELYLKARQLVLR